MVRDGIPYVIIPAFIGAGLLLFGFWVGALLFFALAAFMWFFFRNPRRTAPDEMDIVISPADGKVTRIERLENKDRPDEKSEDGLQVVSIFLSVFDVHINRAPIAGRVTEVTYTNGRFMIATREEASLLNEQNVITIEGEKMTVVCKQIAGVLARRIVCWSKAGDTLALGERFGLIKFGSRTDLIMPAEVEVSVKVGDRVKGGATVIGRLR